MFVYQLRYHRLIYLLWLFVVVLRVFASDRESPRIKAWLPDGGVQHAFPFTCQKRAVRERILVFCDGDTQSIHQQ